jgi:hypothetical protein
MKTKILTQSIAARGPRALIVSACAFLAASTMAHALIPGTLLNASAQNLPTTVFNGSALGTPVETVTATMSTGGNPFTVTEWVYQEPIASGGNYDFYFQVQEPSNDQIEGLTIVIPPTSRAGLGTGGFVLAANATLPGATGQVGAGTGTGVTPDNPIQASDNSSVINFQFLNPSYAQGLTTQVFGFSTNDTTIQQGELDIQDTGVASNTTFWVPGAGPFNPVPEPATYLFGFGLLGAIGLARKRYSTLGIPGLAS